MSTYQQWHCQQDEQGIVWAMLDRNDASVNSLNRAVLEELNQLLNDIANDEQVNALVIGSNKASGFIAGADIEQFKCLKDEDEAFNLIRQGQQVFASLANLNKPTLAMIDGPCLGGGFELALACDYRVASDRQKTKLGLPEVMLGIHPGWGGCVRLPKLIGALKAIPLILQGRSLSAKAAKKLGMIDAAVPLRQLKRAAAQLVLGPRLKRKGCFRRCLSNSRLVRPLLAKLFRRALAKKVKITHYPAPYAVIYNWQKHGVCSDHAYTAEARSIAKLLMTETCQNLVRVFFLQNQLKKQAKVSDFKASHVHVIGAGTMGGDIAAWCALRGLRVTLQDREAKYIAPAIKRAHKLFTKKLKRPERIQAAMDRLIPDTEGYGMQAADVIIEAIFENLDAKQALFKTIEAQAKPTAILASNTSSIPLADIAKAMKKASRLVGIHFFNPVAKMPLVEIVTGQKTTRDVMRRASAFVGQIARMPIAVKSSPGFLVNRVLFQYIMEAVVLWQEGVPAAVIDKAAVDYGMPMGPIELADTVGLDVCLSVAENLSAHYGGQVPAVLLEHVQAKKLGVKTGEGLYHYKKGKACKDKIAKHTQMPANISERLIYRMINEAGSCLREGIVETADLLDIGMIFGTGFAPFRGGPMQVARMLGFDQFRQQLTALSQTYGERFTPDPIWAELAKDQAPAPIEPIIVADKEDEHAEAV